MITTTRNRFFFLVLFVCIASFVFQGCGASKAVQGGAAGAAGGGVVGGVIGRLAGNTATGAIIGAVVGGTAGALIGARMDRQAEEMQRDLEGAKVERVGEGIKITFDSGILFAVDSSSLEAASKQNIEELASILNKYPDTDIVIEGDTDSTGSEEYNQGLSERRAEAVALYSVELGVEASRIQIVGLGETNPIASNDTVEGRRQNRRVEIAIFANDELKKAARDGNL